MHTADAAAAAAQRGDNGAGTQDAPSTSGRGDWQLATAGEDTIAAVVTGAPQAASLAFKRARQWRPAPPAVHAGA